MDQIDHLLDPQEVSKILRVSLSYCYKMADRGILPSVTWSMAEEKRGVLRFKKSDVINFIEAHRAQPET